jgi:DNA-3-methyladenine glycosylase I
MTGQAPTRCWWCGDDELYQSYHDEEWGVPVHDDRLLFEFLCLEGAQAGLSWITILRKRDNYRRAFDNFDAHRIARYDDDKIAALLQDPGIVRNRLKVNGFVKNARAYLALLEQGTTLDHYLWDFVDGEPLQNGWFTFVGSTICYAFMQAAGLVNDHTVDCFRHQQLKRV